MKGIMINGQEVQPDEYGNYSAPGISMSGVNTGGGGSADAMAMFEQVQAAKRARQQQMIDAGLNPMTGMTQAQAPMGSGPTQGPLQGAPPMMPRQAAQQQAGINPRMPQVPPAQPVQRMTCPTCGGAGHI